MTRDPGLRRRARTPAVEPLEGRQLLAQFFAGATPTRPVQASGGMFLLTMNGPGLEKVQHVRGGSVALTLYGTTSASTLNLALTHPRPHAAATPLAISSIRVVSGVLGGITAADATLNGPITPLNGTVSTLQFGSLGPNTQIDVNGGLGNLSAGSIALGPAGHVRIAGDLGQSLSADALSLSGGSFVIGHDLSGALDVGSLNINNGGSFVVGHNLSGGAQVTGALAVANGALSVGNNLTGLSVGQGASLDAGGLVSVGNDLTGAVNISGGLTLTNGGHLSVARDATGTLAVNGDLILASGGSISVGRHLNALTVNGDLSEANGGGPITVGGNFNNLTVNGAWVGNNSPDLIDMSVGLNLGSLNVLGGAAGQGGLEGVNLDVGKQILGLNVPHGIFNSFITAGVLIDGGTSTGGGNVGADGTDAILNSDIRAGVEINHLTINGDVQSTFAVNPNSTGYRTRIVAGEDRAGNWSSGGLIDNFQITGSLIDAVIAASVAPYGGDGSLPSNNYGAPPVVGPPPGDLGNNTYDAPAGYILGGTVGNQVRFPNYSEVSYYNETLIPNPPKNTFYNTALDPTIDDAILFGAINPSFASPPLSQSALTTNQTITSTTQGQTTTTTVSTGTGGSSSSGSATQSNNGTTVTTIVTPNQQVLPLPSKSTVLGGVISTAHGDEADFAGIFAADTRGVFVGAVPSSSG